MNTNIEVLRELDELVEAARLLGVTQAKRGFGCHTDEDRRFERAMYESIDKHRAALLAERDALAADVERLRADVAEWKARADDLAAALHNCIKLAYNRDQDELPSAIITTASKAVAKYDMLVDFSAALDD